MLYIASFHPVTRRNIPTWFCRIGTRKKNLVQHKHLVVIGPISNNLANCKKKDCLLYSQHQELRRRFWQKNGGNTLQRTNTENSKQIFPEKELRCHSPNFQKSCVCERFIYSHDRSAKCSAGNTWTNHGII